VRPTCSIAGNSKDSRNACADRTQEFAQGFHCPRTGISSEGFIPPGSVPTLTASPLSKWHAIPPAFCVKRPQ
jgi:hypothetical protein